MITTPDLHDYRKSGRFGNQLFLMAAAIAAAKEYNTEAIFPSDWPIYPCWKAEDIFQNPVPTDVNILHKNEYHEPHFHYNQIPNKADLAIYGYFQSYKYFEKHSEIVKHYFAGRKDILEYIDYEYADFLPNSVSIHVRRGDYVNQPQNHPTITAEYLKQALNLIDVDNIIVCSDDIEWCKQNLPGHCLYIEKEPMFIDFYLMSKTTHNIISNSSFSWWSAWLNENPNKTIIAPKPWFGPAYANQDTKDLLPPEWKVIDVIRS